MAGDVITTTDDITTTSAEADVPEGDPDDPDNEPDNTGECKDTGENQDTEEGRDHDDVHVPPHDDDVHSQHVYHESYQSENYGYDYNEWQNYHDENADDGDGDYHAGEDY